MDLINFYNKIIKLKEVERTGWVYKDIENPESVADHSFGVTVLAAYIDLPEYVDREKLIKMALSHDFGECEIGDIVWENGTYSNIEKNILVK